MAARDSKPMAGSLHTLERVLLVIGILGTGWYATSSISAAREQAALSRELETARHAAASRGPSSESVLAPRTLVGRIEVPRLRLSAAAREGVDVRTLRGSVGHVPGTALPGAPGNAAFAAHRDSYFRPLKDVRTGDEVIVTTKTAVHRYRVVGTRVVEPSNVSVLDAGDGHLLTLITCYPFNYVGSAPSRFVVQAVLQTRAK